MTKTYELREHGQDWAVARESTPGSPFWVVARYDWSDPDFVRWTVVDSSFGGDGDGTVRISGQPGGGSLVHAERSNTHPRRQRLLLRLFSLVPGRMIGRMWAVALDRYA